MKSISELRMQYIFLHNKEFSSDDLQRFINDNLSKDTTPIILIGNLLSDSYTNKKYNYSDILPYISYVVQQYCILYPSTLPEKLWIQFYFTLAIMGYNKLYITMIYRQYKSLPKILTLKKERQIIAERMLPYYYAQYKDYSELQNIYQGGLL